MHTVIIERMSRYTRWFRQYKAAKGYTALQGLADKIKSDWYYDETIAKAIRTTRIINYELELCGSVNIQDKNGRTVLHYAAMTNAVDALKVLLTRPEIEVNKQDKFGSPALNWAAWRNAVEAVKVLLTRPEIDVNIHDIYGWTALHDAARENAVDALKVLVNFGVDKSIKDINGKLAYDLTRNKEIREMLKQKS